MGKFPDTEEQTLEEKCELLMNIVVETRKQYGKMCVDYGQKIILVENKMLKLNLMTLGQRCFKSKNYTPHVTNEEMTKDIDECRKEFVATEKRIENLKQTVTNLQNIVLQLKEDVIGQKLRRQITAETIGKG